MTAYQIKLLAIIFMIIDHVGFFYFPEVMGLRMVGRLAFPLFAWLIANGAYHTKNIDRYLKRLFVFALVAQMPFTIAYQQVGHSYFYFNVLFTLFLGLLAIRYIKQTSNKRLQLIIVVLCAFAAFIFNTDYSAGGVVCVVLFYVFFNNFKYLVLSQSLLFLGQLLLIAYLYGSRHLDIPEFFYIKPLALLSLIFVYFYNRKEGRKARYLFYAVYPLQYVLVILYAFIK